MKIFENNLFILLISFVVSLVVLMNNKPVEFTGKHLLYFGLELFVVIFVTFIVIKIISVLILKIIH
ncbi:hypothetical protein B4W74_12595 [Staphylococcus intermedius]|nr:hypothetical protein B4W74_12595 [Staphylococcus intermedius]PCF77848.1 hypothetical protein B4W70_12355 [Staphylococcus intermedius]